MIEDVFDFFFRHPLLCNCMKILVGGCIVAVTLGFGAAGFVHAFFEPELFWDVCEVVAGVVMIAAALKCLFLCVYELFSR